MEPIGPRESGLNVDREHRLDDDQGTVRADALRGSAIPEAFDPRPGPPSDEDAGDRACASDPYQDEGGEG